MDGRKEKKKREKECANERMNDVGGHTHTHTHVISRFR